MQLQKKFLFFFKLLFIFSFSFISVFNLEKSIFFISEITIKGSGVSIKEQEFFDKIFLNILEEERIVKGSLFSEIIPSLIVEKFQNEFLLNGRFDSTVLVNVLDNCNVTKSITILYILKNKHYIRKININGANSFNEQYLKKYVLPFSEKSFTSVLTGSSLFLGESETISRIESSLTNFFYNCGYLDAVVHVKVFIKKKEDNIIQDKGYGGIFSLFYSYFETTVITVNIDVTENNIYFFQDVTFFLEDKALDDNLYKKILNIINFYIVSGNCYSLKKITNCKKHIIRFLKSLSYCDVYVDLSCFCGADDKFCFINVRCRVIINEKFFVNRIIIRGNIFTQDYVLRRFIIQKESDIFNYVKILKSKDLMLIKNYVSDVHIKIVKSKVKKNCVNVFFFIKENKQHTMFFNFDYFFGKDNDFLSISYAEFKNFLGSAKKVFCFLETQNKFSHFIFDFSSFIYDNYRFKVGFRLEVVNLMKFRTDFYDKIIKLLSAYKYLNNFYFCEHKNLANFRFRYMFSKKYCLKLETCFVKYFFLKKLAFFDIYQFNSHMLAYGSNCWDFLLKMSLVYKNIPVKLLFKKSYFGILCNFFFEVTPFLTYPIKYYKFGCRIDGFNMFYNNIIFRYTCDFGFFNVFSNKDQGNISLLYPVFRNYGNNLFAIRGFLQGTNGPYKYDSEAKKNIYIGGNVMFYCQFSILFNFTYLKSVQKFFRVGFFIDVGQIFNTFYKESSIYFKNTYFPRIGYGLVFLIKLPEKCLPPVSMSLGYAINNESESINSLISLDCNKFDFNVFN